MKPHEIIEFIITEAAKDCNTYWQSLLSKSQHEHQAKAKCLAVGIIAVVMGDEYAQETFKLSKNAVDHIRRFYWHRCNGKPHRIQAEIYEAIQKKLAA